MLRFTTYIIFKNRVNVIYIKGAALVDVRSDLGQNAVQDIENEFGQNKAIFIKTDVTDYVEYEGQIY